MDFVLAPLDLPKESCFVRVKIAPGHVPNEEHMEFQDPDDPEGFMFVPYRDDDGSHTSFKRLTAV
jgi:hypothetical protein